MSVIVVFLLVGGYFGFTYVRKWQDAANEKRREVERNSDGGQVGHIMDLNAVLDATDPNNFSRYAGGAAAQEAARRAGNSGDEEEGEGRASRTTAAPEKPLPVIPAVWTLDVAAARIPEGRVNGKIAGTNFVADLVRVDPSATSQVLTLRQGTGVSADRELLIYLRLNPGEKLENRKWTVSKDTKSAQVGQIVKRWKTNPRFAPQQKVFSSGYALKLEFGPLVDDTLSGKIYVALPDPEQTVAAGLFKIKFAPVVTFMPGEDM